jgi:23S rRNA (cytidine1920-2'-O)/16S rRNA (cytidine1409-2'-O)-methyltransferase
VSAVRRRLDVELVRRGLAPSRRRAAEAVAAGRVLVDGSVAATPAHQVAPAQALHVADDGPHYASRGGDKLAAALDEFAVSVAGRPALDAGASTGGFTDCLLQYGAVHVVAVDVGRSQLAWSLRTDPRVTVFERTDIRDFDAEAAGGPFPVCTADLSFISLTKVAAALARATTADADLLLLVKPQFEVGKGQVPRGGVVRDPAAHHQVLVTVVAGLAAAGLVAVGVIPSPLRGADGNVEFVLHARKSGTPVGSSAIAAAVSVAHAGRS